MKRTLSFAIAGLLVPGLFAFDKPPAAGPPGFQQLSYEQAVAKGRRDKKAVMIHFGASWCAPCKKMESTTFTNRRVEKFLSDNLIAIKVDYDHNRQLAQEHNITALPTILFLDSGGKEVKRITGYQDPGEFLKATSNLAMK